MTSTPATISTIHSGLKPPCSSIFVGVSLLLEVVSGLLALSLDWVGTLDSGSAASEASEETGAS